MAYRERLTKTRVHDFSALDGKTQQAFVDAVNGVGGTPVVLANRAMPLGSSVHWLALTLGGTLVLALATLPGWSLLESRPLVDAWLLPFALGGTAVALGAVGLMRRRFALRGLPYPPGVYVLPTQLVDARGARLRLRPLTELHSDPERAVSGTKDSVVLTFSDGETFAFRDSDSPEDVRRQLDGLRSRTATAEAEGDADDLGVLQPFPIADYAASEDAYSPPLVARARMSGRTLLLVTAGLGCLSGVGVREVRERLSESSAIDSAHVRHDAAGLWRYVDGGGRLQRQADRALLELATKDRENAALVEYLKKGRDTDRADRMLFERASKEGTVVALEMYLSSGKRHRAEAEAQLLNLARASNRRQDFERYLAVAQHDAPLVRRKLLPEADISVANEPQQVLALRHYLSEDVAPEVKQEVQRRIDALYAAELTRYDKLTGQGRQRELVVKMLERLKAGRRLKISVQPSSAPGLDARIADFLLRNENGVSPKTFLARESKIVGSLRLSAAHGLHRVFDEQVVPIVDDEVDPAAHLTIRYEVSATDSIWVSHDQNKTFLSLRVSFEVELRVPGVEQGASGTTRFEADRLWYRRHSGRTPYSQMFENAGSELEHEVERLIRE